MISVSPSCSPGKANDIKPQLMSPLVKSYTVKEPLTSIASGSATNPGKYKDDGPNLRVQTSDRVGDVSSSAASSIMMPQFSALGGSTHNMNSPGLANITQQLIADTSASATQIFA